MTPVSPSTVLKPAIRVATAGLCSAVGGPLGGLTGAFIGGMLGQVFGDALGELGKIVSEAFAERTSETVLHHGAESLVERLKNSRPHLESIYREAFRLCLVRIHLNAGNDHDSWFANWDRCLKANVRLNLEEIRPDQLKAEEFDQRLRNTMERLDAQGTAVQQESQSLVLITRRLPDLLLDLLKSCLSEHFEEIFHELIVQPENIGAWNEEELAFRDRFSAAFAHFHRVLAKVDQKTDALPRMENMLGEVLRRSRHAETENGKPSARRELSAKLKEAKDLARVASRNHDPASALLLWARVQKEAEKEDNFAEALGARLETVLVLAWDEPNPTEALKLADTCLQDAKDIDLGDDKCRLLQIIGEIHRIKGNKDQARGFLTSALQQARKMGFRGDEGMALLALSNLEESDAEPANGSKALGMIELAYNSFSTHYSSGDSEKQKIAKHGFAECHLMRATVLGRSRPDDAIAEWTRSIELFESLGEDWEWEVAEAMLCRAKLRGRVGDQQAAAAELEKSAKVFDRIGNSVGVARCYLEAGELLDAIGKRDIAAEPYQKAAAIAATWENDRKASYFYFRYAMKLMELKKFEDADRILAHLVEADSLETKQKLDVISLMCLAAKATKKHEELKKRCSRAIALTDELIEAAASPEERRSLLIKKGTILEESDQHDEALACFHDAIRRFEAVHDQVGVAECWFQIRGVMQQLGDSGEERNASERVLTLGGDKLSSVLVGLTLVGLAQLDIKEQRFVEARKNLDRAEQVDPDNPAVTMVAAHLRRELPQLISQGPYGESRLHKPPDRDLPSLLRELHEWCNWCPQKQDAILPLWYYLHRTNMQGIIRSLIGAKFLVCSKDANAFERMRNAIRAHGDLFIWGTNFDSRTIHNPEVIPFPNDLILPEGTKFVFPRGTTQSSVGEVKPKKGHPPGEPRLLKPVKDLGNEPYFAALLAKSEDFPDGGPVFGGDKRRFDRKVSKFMLGPPVGDLGAECNICLPLTEGSALPNLRRTMQVAWESGAIPVFSLSLPVSREIGGVCDSAVELPTDDEASRSVVSTLWLELLSSCAGDPRSSLTAFTKRMAALCGPECRVRTRIRAYILQFESDGRQVVHPAMVILSR